jgi:DNA replication protein DnaC
MNVIENELKSLRLPGMAQCWLSLLETRRIDALSVEDCLQLLLQAEKDHRRTNRNARLIKEARFRYQASLEEVIFDAARGVDKSKVFRLATCDYIRQGTPVIITGATGTGKSYLATALGYHACLNGFHVAYFNLQKLFEQITLARIAATLPKFFDRMASLDLLIIDDFGMKCLDGQQLLDFLEIIEDRHARRSTILISQLPVKEWYEVMKTNATAADSVLDRLVHTACRFELKGESLRRKIKKDLQNEHEIEKIY